MTKEKSKDLVLKDVLHQMALSRSDICNRKERFLDQINYCISRTKHALRNSD